MRLLDPALPPDQWPAPATDYEADTLQFCRDWRAGQSEFILHTSGSTGAPKPIRLTRAQMLASAHLTGAALGLQPGDPALVCLNVRYVAGTMMLVRGLELGLPMTILEPTTHLLDVLPPKSRFAFTALVPLQLQSLLAAPDRGLPLLNPMKAILVGGAATGPALEQVVQQVVAPVWATYGMTETVSHIALRRLNGPTASGWFTPLPGVMLGLDERGCLHIQSAATNFERLQTNDLADLQPDGRFRLLGRADTIINTGGVKVSPEAVERVIGTVLARRGLSARLFVAGLPDERLGQRVMVISEQLTINNYRLSMNSEQLSFINDPVLGINGLPEGLLAAAQDAVRREVGPYAAPKDWLTISAFAETPTGKIDRRATISMIQGFPKL